MFIQSNKKQSEQKIAEQRIAEKHPAGCRAELRQANSQRLNKSGKILRITGIVDPRHAIGDDIEGERRGERCRQERFPRSAALQEQPKTTDNSKANVVRDYERTNE